jgi:hypothetical protein
LKYRYRVGCLGQCLPVNPEPSTVITLNPESQTLNPKPQTLNPKGVVAHHLITLKRCRVMRCARAGAGRLGPLTGSMRWQGCSVVLGSALYGGGFIPQWRSAGGSFQKVRMPSRTHPLQKQADTHDQRLSRRLPVASATWRGRLGCVSSAVPETVTPTGGPRLPNSLQTRCVSY